jgi:glycerol-3-phosphate acyltransferase PlsX
MGGDHAPGAVVAGAVAAARDLDVTIHLVGPTALVGAELARMVDASASADRSRISQRIIHIDAPDVIGMDDAPLAALRRKPQASIKVAAEAVAHGTADALYSAGHTGATMLAAHGAFGLLPGAERPALAVLMPTLAGQSVLLDTGATLDCRPEHLVAFARMGAAYARVVLSLDDPRVGLLSIGEEASKGNDLVRDAQALLAAVPGLNFVGNLDARDLFSGTVDVIVADGFTGNIALKVGEGLVETLEQMLKRELGQSLAAKVASRLVGPGFVRLRRRVDAAERGGAPLLGVNGLAIVAHGRADARAIRNGIALTARLVEGGMIARLTHALLVP